MSSKYSTLFIITICITITNEKSMKLIQTDTTPHFHHSTRSNNKAYGTLLIPYTLCPTPQASAGKVYMVVSKIYSQLCERVCAREVWNAIGIVSICINFTNYSFVMTYNNKKKLCHIWMLCYMCPKPAPLMLQIPYI